MLSFSSLRKFKLPSPKSLSPLLILLLMVTLIPSIDTSKLFSFLMLGIFLSLYLHLSNLDKNSKIELYHHQNFQAKNVKLDKLTYLKDAHFHPTPYLSHPILQAMYNHKTTVFKSDIININFHREYIRLPDCGQVSLDASFVNYSSRKLLVIIHGLTGGSDMPYVRALVEEAHKEGFNALVFHNRGINKTFLTTPEPFHAAKVDDFNFVSKYIKEKYHGHDLYLAGFSFGANQLLRFLGSSERQMDFKAAVAISAPFSLLRTMQRIDGTIYDRNFVKQYIRNIINPNFEVLKRCDKGVDYAEVFKTTNTYKLHETFSIKIFGYQSVHDYLNAGDVTVEMIHNFKIPVLILNSKDDLVTERSEKHLMAIQKNENVLYAETEKGGHVCWFTGTKPTRWYPKPTLEFFKAF